MKDLIENGNWSIEEQHQVSQDHARSNTAVTSGKSHTPGPYWLNHTGKGEIHVCGHRGKILFRFPADQEPLAQAQRNALQKRQDKADQAGAARLEAIRDAAPAMLEALKQIAIEAEREQGNWLHLKRVIGINARTAIAKAEGQ